ncbi:MAG: NUDIX domain-containing protein [Planctomycetes bacterium]|nr:NUDIX domain-containing protein [Planctomycetota bacterium]
MSDAPLEELEFVWVVPRADLFGTEAPHGFVSTEDPNFDPKWLETCEHRGFFVERQAAEQNPAWKQVIPYCLLLSPEGLFTVERLPRGSEARLHGKLSVGIGGHIEPRDRVPHSTPHGSDRIVLRAARRELEEELVLRAPTEFECLGLVNDDSNAVGSVHIGIVLMARVDELPAVRESDRLRAFSTPLVDFLSVCDASAQFESWSAYILSSTNWNASIVKIE